MSRRKMNRSKTQGDLSSNKYTYSKESNDDKKNNNDIKIKSNSIHGYDKKYYPNSGDRHEGYYNGGLRHGLGIYLWFNGDKYTGDWEYDLMNGQGYFQWANGEEYKGTWSKGQMHGKGIKIEQDGSILEGLFQSGLLHGWGSKRFIEGDRYQGDFKIGCRYGYGEYIWMDGSSYKGFWNNDQMTGHGVLITSINIDIRKHSLLNIFHQKKNAYFKEIHLIDLWKQLESIVWYKGEFHSDHLQGCGTAEMSDGSIYSGNWNKSQFHGWGKLSYKDDNNNTGGTNCYQGEFQAGKKHGMGIYSHNLINERIHINYEDIILEEPILNIDLEHITDLIEQQQQVIEEFDFELQWNMYTIDNILNTWGGVYSGEWRCDYIHGQGVLRLNNGQVVDYKYIYVL